MRRIKPVGTQVTVSYYELVESDMYGLLIWRHSVGNLKRAHYLQMKAIRILVYIEPHQSCKKAYQIRITEEAVPVL